MGNVSVIGLGKLGACLAAFYADRGCNVIGMDIDKDKVDSINRAEAPVTEPELSSMIKKNKARLLATNSIEDAILKTDITFMIMPTPSKKDGSFSVDFVLDAVKKIGTVIKNKKKYHLFVLVSTVLPEDSRSKIIPTFEKYSGKECGKDFGYCYSPSLIALGNVVANLQKPDFLFLGAFDKKAGDILDRFYKKIYGSGDKIKRMSIESAELAKISLNSYVTMKITFSNVLGEVCDKIFNADVDEVTDAIGDDKRIGSYFFRSGLGYGGPCFPRDNFAFANMAKKRGVSTPLALITHEINEAIPGNILKIIKSISVNKKQSIGILSLAYKPNTSIVEESQSIKLAKLLVRSKYSVIAYDVLGYDYAKPVLKDSIRYANDLLEVAKKSKVIFIANRDDEFKALPEILKNIKEGRTVVDPWGMFKEGQFDKKDKYISIGRRSDYHE